MVVKRREVLDVKKGDLRRNSILTTAEALFLDKGYECTSVQDILDALNLSKGGFYHHFASKEQILQEICEERAESRFARLGMELYDSRIRPMDKLNRLLSLANLFDREEPRFVAMMLKVCYLDGDVRMRDHMRAQIHTRLRVYFDDVLEAGITSGDFFVRHPGRIGSIVLGMVSDADDEACRRIATEPDNPECIIEIAELLDACRDAVEMLLGAPFGSVQLFDPAKLVVDFQAAAAELRKLEAK